MWGGSTRFSLPENNMNRANVIESHAMQYMKKSKEEIKIAMKAMIKAERSLEAGNLESSFIRTAYKVPK